MEQNGEKQENAKFIAVSLLGLIAFLGAITNLLVLKAIFSLKRRKVHEYLLLNLVATNAGTCLVSIPLDIAEHLIGRFPYGAALCRVIYPFQSALVYVSVLTLLFMSAERYRLIVTPMKPTIRAKTALITITVMWVSPCLIVLPYSFALKVTQNGHCIEEWSYACSGRVFTLTIFAFLYVTPLLIMTVFYVSMIRVLFKDSNAVKLRTKISLSQSSISLRQHRNVKIVKVFIAAVTVFALCMLPTHVTWLWHDFGHGSTNKERFHKVLTFSKVVMYANSLFNPFIFGSKLLSDLIYYRLARQERHHGFQRVFLLRIRGTSVPARLTRGKLSSLSNTKTQINTENVAIASL